MLESDKSFYICSERFEENCCKRDLQVIVA